MPRSVPEWIGKTDDTPLPDRVKLRILDRQGNCCAETGSDLGPANPPEFDHITPLALGGENRESNFQALCRSAHRLKTTLDAGRVAKANSVRKKHMGVKKTKNPLPGGRGSPLKRKIGGKVVKR